MGIVSGLGVGMPGYRERATPLVVAPTGGYSKRVLAPDGEVLSCRDTKVSKETLPPGLRPHTPRLPSPTGLTQGVQARHVRVPGLDARRAALRYPCSCLQARGSPSVASPFSGTKVPRTFVLIRFTLPAPLRARSSSAFGARLDQGGQKKQSNSLPLNGGGLGRGCSAR